ncbi:MAG TPA: TrmH family RNA methyltransferase [Polyangiaceae bacterium]|nr:TrmH family RNA methyltransferase [Polyangiaceae bacterium]
MDVFLYAPEQFENLCVLARTLEVFGFERCHVFDPHRIVRERYGKSYGQKLRTVSAGAFFKITWQRIEQDPLSFLRGHPGRRVATVPRKDAASLHYFRFRESDLLVIGAERSGLPVEVLAECEARVTIPQAGVTESLNVAVASGIVLAEFKRQEALGLLANDAAQEEARDS